MSPAWKGDVCAVAKLTLLDPRVLWDALSLSSTVTEQDPTTPGDKSRVAPAAFLRGVSPPGIPEQRG